MSSSSVPSSRPDNSRLGIIYMLAAMVTFTIVNGLIKDAAARYPVIQIVFFRNAFALIPCLLWLRRSEGCKALQTSHLPRHIMCGVFGALGLYCGFTSLKLLPLANATTIHFSSTLFLTAFSALLLKEHAGIRRWLIIALGFSGVLVMVKPTQFAWEMGVVVALLFAIIDAAVMVNARLLTRTDNSASIVTYFALFASLTTGLILPFVWQLPSLKDALLLSLMGLGGGFGQILLTQAYRHAPAATVAPMIYSALLWSVGLGFLVWGEVPDSTLLLGASLIIISGLLIVYDESIKHRPITIVPPEALSEGEEQNS